MGKGTFKIELMISSKELQQKILMYFEHGEFDQGFEEYFGDKIQTDTNYYGTTTKLKIDNDNA